MEVKFEASKEELEELAKMAFVAQFVFDSSGKFSDGYKYPFMKQFGAALRTVNKLLVQHIPESGLVEVDERSEQRFTHTIKMEEACEKVLLEFGESCFLEELCKQITDRDYTEKYKGSLEDVSSFSSDIYHILHEGNMKELEENGVSRLRFMDES